MAALTATGNRRRTPPPWRPRRRRSRPPGPHVPARPCTHSKRVPGRTPRPLPSQPRCALVTQHPALLADTTATAAAAYDHDRAELQRRDAQLDRLTCDAYADTLRRQRQVVRNLLDDFVAVTLMVTAPDPDTTVEAPRPVPGAPVAVGAAAAAAAAAADDAGVATTDDGTGQPPSLSSPPPIDADTSAGLVLHGSNDELYPIPASTMDAMVHALRAAHQHLATAVSDPAPDLPRIRAHCLQVAAQVREQLDAPPRDAQAGPVPAAGPTPMPTPMPMRRAGDDTSAAAPAMRVPEDPSLPGPVAPSGRVMSRHSSLSRRGIALGFDTAVTTPTPTPTPSLVGASSAAAPTLPVTGSRGDDEKLDADRPPPPRKRARIITVASLASSGAAAAFAPAIADARDATMPSPRTNATGAYDDLTLAAAALRLQPQQLQHTADAASYVYTPRHNRPRYAAAATAAAVSAPGLHGATTSAPRPAALSDVPVLGGSGAPAAAVAAATGASRVIAPPGSSWAMPATWTAPAVAPAALTARAAPTAAFGRANGVAAAAAGAASEHLPVSPAPSMTSSSPSRFVHLDIPVADRHSALRTALWARQRARGGAVPFAWVNELRDDLPERYEPAPTNFRVGGTNVFHESARHYEDPQRAHLVGCNCRGSSATASPSANGSAGAAVAVAVAGDSAGAAAAVAAAASPAPASAAPSSTLAPAASASAPKATAAPLFACDDTCQCVLPDFDAQERWAMYEFDSALGQSVVPRLQPSQSLQECNSKCDCSHTCPNRVLQNATRHGDGHPSGGGVNPTLRDALLLFRTPFCGWGVRTLCDIPAHTFVCEYAGEWISAAEAAARERRGDNPSGWLWTEDMSGDGGESGAHGVDVLTVDAGPYGNVARFINHSCAPNLMAARVHTEHQDHAVFHIAFFAKRQIPSGTELTLDYQDKIDPAATDGGMNCYCGALNCRKRLR